MRMENKKPFLKVDYSALDEALERQEDCPHSVYDIIDKDKVEAYRYGMKRDIDVVYYICADCGKEFSKKVK